MSQEEAIRKGNAAKALLENPDFNIAIDAVRLQAFKAWASSDPAQQKEREENYYLLKGIEQLKDNLNALISNAKFEVMKIERDEKEKPSSEKEKED